MPSTAETITVETWKDWDAAGRRAQLLDVRSPTEFAAAHLPGAINIPWSRLNYARRTSMLMLRSSWYARPVHAHTGRTRCWQTPENIS